MISNDNDLKNILFLSWRPKMCNLAHAGIPMEKLNIKQYFNNLLIINYWNNFFMGPLLFTLCHFCLHLRLLSPIEIGLEQAPFVFFNLFFSTFEHLKSLLIMGLNNIKNSSLKCDFHIINYE